MEEREIADLVDSGKVKIGSFVRTISKSEDKRLHPDYSDGIFEIIGFVKSSRPIIDTTRVSNGCRLSKEIAIKFGIAEKFIGGFYLTIAPYFIAKFLTKSGNAIGLSSSGSNKRDRMSEFFFPDEKLNPERDPDSPWEFL